MYFMKNSKKIFFFKSRRKSQDAKLKTRYQKLFCQTFTAFYKHNMARQEKMFSSNANGLQTICVCYE